MKKLKISGVLFVLLLAMSCENKKPADPALVDTAATKTPAIAVNPSYKTILFFGDSLTAGYGLDDPSQAFPGVIKARIDSLKQPYNIVNAGVSGETSADGLSRINWILKQKVDIFVLELGANDGLRGLSVQQTGSNLQAIIDQVRAKYPQAKIILAGMQIPPNMGKTYVHDFKALFPALASKNHIALVPFLLAGVAGEQKLNQADGIHPTAAGAKIVANNVWEVLKKAI
jgi:acyl-CoA thioesterase-1